MSLWLSDILVEGATGVVHSVFDRAANLLLGERLVAVHDQAFGPTPLAITVDVPPGGLRAVGWRAGQAAAMRGGFLWVGPSALQLTGRPWDPLSVCPPLRPEPEIPAANAGRLAAFLAAFGQRGGMLDAVLAVGAAGAGPEGNVGPGPKSPVCAAARLESGVEGARDSCGADMAGAGAVRALAMGDVVAARQLVGLGPGLTPSGDDMLAGLMATLWLGQASRDAKRLSQAVLSELHRTTTVSAALLQAAARGGLPRRCGLLLRDMLSKRNSDALQHGPAALAMGHTSGTDLCCGVLLGLKWLAMVPGGAGLGAVAGPSIGGAARLADVLECPFGQIPAGEAGRPAL